MNYQLLLEKQQAYYHQNGPFSLKQRLAALKKLKVGLMTYESRFEGALKKDLGKSQFESYTSEISFLCRSIDHVIKNLAKWSAPKRVKADIAQLVGQAMVYPSAYGTALIIGPFNYPVQLLIEPLIGAIAAGNTAILKPSELTPSVEAVLVQFIEELFDENYVAIVTGGIEVNQALLNLSVDYIFFTGSVKVGKIVMEKASQQLIPFTLELGGKSPVVVEETADLKLAAKRIVWGKFMNAGQTCVAPDYVLVHESIYDQFLVELRQTITQFYGENPKESEDFGRIVNREHTKRLQLLMNNTSSTCIVGGEVDLDTCYVCPTIFKDVTLEDVLMQDELFGPLLPTMSYESIQDIDDHLNAHKKPLAFYVFSENDAFSEQLLQRYAFGGGCVNDTVTQVASTYLPFGGVGPSGIGRYHGESSFKTFTYEKSIVKRSTKVNVSLVFPPYKGKLKLLKKFLK